MNKQVKKSLVPELRFPEFRDAGEWKTKHLDNFAVIVRGGSPRPIDEFITNDANGLNWLKIGDIDKESKFVKSTQEKVIPAALTKTRVVKPGDLILSNSMSFGRPYILEIETCIHDGWIAVSEIEKSLDRDYLYYLMMTSVSQTYFSNNAAGSGVQNLNADIIKLLPVLYPNKTEQEKIADCLSSIDELVTAQTQKIEALKAHKKGLMQQLFPAEGETTPKLRFPEFRDEGEWKQKKLSAVAELTSSKRVHLSDYVPSGIPFFRGKEISILRNSRLPDDLLYISEEHYDEIKEKYGVPQIGDILITAVGTLGNVYCVRNSDKFYFKDGNLIWMKNISENPMFLEILLNVKSEDVLSSAIGSSQKALTMVELNKLEFRFPKKEEQQKIANCLSSIDELITAQTQKLSALKTHKKGLMQQLFPTVDDEVNE